MLLKPLCALALTAISTAAAAKASPLFVLSSTADIDITFDSSNHDVQAADIQHSLWGYLSTCPTKHYAVVVEPLALSYSSSWLIPVANNAQVLLSHGEYNGRVNLNHVLNTILMDCLHHNVLRVEELDTSADALTRGVPNLDQEVIDKSIMYADLPEVDQSLTEREYTSIMRQRKNYVEGLINKYFDEENYTLIYIREREVPAKASVGDHEDGSEIPLNGKQKV